MENDIEIKIAKKIASFFCEKIAADAAGGDVAEEDPNEQTMKKIKFLIYSIAKKMFPDVNIASPVSEEEYSIDNNVLSQLAEKVKTYKDTYITKSNEAYYINDDLVNAFFNCDRAGENSIDSLLSVIQPIQ